MNTLSPAYSKVEIGNTLIVSLEEARDWIGIFSDDSEDDTVTALLEAAEKRVRELTNGVQLSRASVADYFPRFYQWMVLSTRPVIGDETDITVKYRDSDGQEQIVQSSEYVLDTSVKIPCLSLEVPEASLSSRVTNPVSISYDAGLERATDKRNADLKFAIRRAIWIMYNSRNEEKMVEIDNILLSVLSSYHLGVV